MIEKIKQFMQEKPLLFWGSIGAVLGAVVLMRSRSQSSAGAASVAAPAPSQPVDTGPVPSPQPAPAPEVDLGPLSKMLGDYLNTASAQLSQAQAQTTAANERANTALAAAQTAYQRAASSFTEASHQVSASSPLTPASAPPPAPSEVTLPVPAPTEQKDIPNPVTLGDPNNTVMVNLNGTPEPVPLIRNPGAFRPGMTDAEYYDEVIMGQPRKG